MSEGRMAALYVDPKGVYSGLEDVDVWDETPWKGDKEQHDAHVRHYRSVEFHRQLERRNENWTPNSELHRDLDRQTSCKLSAILYAFEDDFKCLGDES